MNKLKTAMVVGVGIATISGTGLGVASASAMNGGGHTDTDSNSNWGWEWKDKRDDSFDAKLAANLSAKFNLDKTEVAKAIAETRDDQFNVLSEKRLATLQDAVDNETITQEQYDTIVQHLTTIDEQYDQLNDTQGEERKALWNQIKDEFKELRTWIKDESISLKLVGFGEVRKDSHDHQNKNE